MSRPLWSAWYGAWFRVEIRDGHRRWVRCEAGA